MENKKIEVYEVYQLRTTLQEILGRVETAYSILAQTGDQTSARVHLNAAAEKLKSLTTGFSL